MGPPWVAVVVALQLGTVGIDNVIGTVWVGSGATWAVFLLGTTTPWSGTA